MTDFEIRLESPAAQDASGPGRLSIRLGESSLTRLIRRGSPEPDDCLEAPPLPLAFWFVDNWWRIHSEPPPNRDLDVQWRLAHHLSSVGAGYHWPNVSIWGEGSRFGVAVHADASNLQPSLKFVAPPRLEYVPSWTVEKAIDRFILDVLNQVGTACDGLGAEPLQEAALAHQGVHANAALDKCLEAAGCSNVVVRTPFAVNEFQIDRPSLRPPWLLAANAADRLRDWLGVPSGPLRNTRLSEIVGINVDHLKSNRRSSFNIPYALRLRDDANRASRLALRSPWSHSRRFELSRSLGDIIWSCDDALGPLSAAKSERQKFQRAFAQAFLCPFADLQAYINTEEPTEEDIHAAARHFHVSERLIQTALYNNHVIDQASFEQMVDAA